MNWIDILKFNLKFPLLRRAEKKHEGFLIGLWRIHQFFPILEEFSAFENILIFQFRFWGQWKTRGCRFWGGEFRLFANFCSTFLEVEGLYTDDRSDVSLLWLGKASSFFGDAYDSEIEKWVLEMRTNRIFQCHDIRLCSKTQWNFIRIVRRCIFCCIYLCIYHFGYLKPETSIYKVFFQLDDSKSLLGKTYCFNATHPVLLMA